MKNDDIRNKIVTHYAGSHAYGTNTPTSDVDIRGIFCADKIQIVTPFFPIREVTVEDQEDSKLFEVRNYLKLYLDANPNILETLWVPDDKIIETTQEYELLKQHRQSLLSSKVAFTYSGYAVAQMKRLVNHHKHQSSMWILLELATAVKHALDNNDIDINWVFTRYGTDFLGFCGFSTVQTDYKIVDIEQNTKHDIAKYAVHATMDQFVKFEKPVRSDFLTVLHNYTNNNKSKVSDFRYDHALIPYGSNIYAVVKFTGESLYNNDGSIRTLSITSSDMFKLPVQCLVKLNESSYNDACSWVDKYWSWYNGRNAVRAEMERKYGYDTKFAMHLVRLLRTADECLSTGIINVYRHDAQELLAIRNGTWTYNELIEYTEYMDNRIKELYKQTFLPKVPDVNLAAKVLMQVQDSIWSNSSK